MGKLSFRTFVTSIIIISFGVNFVSAQELCQCSMEIIYPGDDDELFEVSDEGSVNVEFYFDNSGLIDLQVEFEYDIPFDADYDGPETATISGNSNDSFQIKISGIDVGSILGGSSESFSIEAEIVGRQGVPDLTSLVGIAETKNASSGLKIPEIYNLEVEISDPFGPINSGSSTNLIVTVTNSGNIADGIEDLEITDDCPLMTTEELLPDSFASSMQPEFLSSGISSDSQELEITVSESHPKRNCDIEIMITSKASAAKGNTVISRDEVRISVEPGLKDEGDSGSSDNGDGDIVVEEVVTTSLPAPNIILIVLSVLAASLIHKRLQENQNKFEKI